MLAKKYRLPVQTAIGKKAKEARSPLFLVKIFESPLPHSRFGVVLKKGSVKKASDRNRIRRAIFSAAGIMQKDFNLPHSDFLLIGGSGLAQLSGAEIEKEVIHTFNAILRK